MRTESKKLLSDILTAARAIQEFNAGKSQADYQSNLMQRAATERQFEIIGEAMTRLRDTDGTTFSQVAEAALIIAFRNRLIHGYDTVDDEIVWEVIQQNYRRSSSKSKHCLELIPDLGESRPWRLQPERRDRFYPTQRGAAADARGGVGEEKIVEAIE